MKQFISLFFLLCGINVLVTEIKCFKAEGIVRGEIAHKGGFKYQVSLHLGKKHKCGGGIIDHIFIITAAHCVIDDTTGVFYRDLLIVSALDVQTLHPSMLQVKVIKIFVPKIYDPENYLTDKLDIREADLAVLMLDSSLGKSHDTKISELDIPEQDFTNLNETLIIAGYGYNAISLKTNPNNSYPIEHGSSDYKLRFGEVKIIENTECSDLIKVTIAASLICAKMTQNEISKPKGTCRGDSGSPLVRGRNVIGILISGPIGCDESWKPAIYTSVSYFSDFINNVTRNNRTSDMRIAKFVRISAEMYGFVEA